MKKPSITVIAIFQMIICLSFCFDILYWWRDVGTSFWILGFPILFIAGNGVIGIMCYGLWSEVFNTRGNARQNTASAKITRVLMVNMAVIVVMSLFLMATTIFGIRTIRADNYRITGFLVPGGRAMFVANMGAPTINNYYKGSLAVRWTTSQGREFRYDKYDLSGGKPSDHIMTETSYTIIRQRIDLPAMVNPDMFMNWNCSGTTRIFANRSGSKRIEAWGPSGGTVTVHTDTRPFNISGSVQFGAVNQRLHSLVELKECYRLIVWPVCIVLLVLSYGCLFWIGYIS